MTSSDRPEKMQEEKACNCRNSKCMKLYCQCFAAGQECTKQCRCTDCQNQKDRENFKTFKSQGSLLGAKSLSFEGVKVSKGCSCRKSFCVKKYCECFQDGLLCNQTCKCIDCQNNESMTNRNVLINLKRNTSNTSNKQCSLYPIVLSQSKQHLNSMISQENPLEIEERQLVEDARVLIEMAVSGNVESLLDNFINILKKIENSCKSQKQETVKKENSD